MKYLVFSLLILGACSTKSDSVSDNLDPQAFKSQIDAAADGVVLDVRTPDEVAQGIIAGAKVIDFKSADFDQQITTLDKDKTYFVYCASGGRSGKAASLMREKGFEKVYSLDGGFTAWKEQGLEVVDP